MAKSPTPTKKPKAEKPKPSIVTKDLVIVNGVDKSDRRYNTLFTVTDISQDGKYARLECKPKNLVDVEEVADLTLREGAGMPANDMGY